MNFKYLVSSRLTLYCSEKDPLGKISSFQLCQLPRGKYGSANGIPRLWNFFQRLVTLW